MNFDQWQQDQGISPVSPEAYYAELAWNAAVDEALKIAKAIECRIEPFNELKTKIG